MTLADIAAGTTVFVDANILVFAPANHPTHGAACDAFLDRVENRWCLISVASSCDYQPASRRCTAGNVSHSRKDHT